MARPVTDHVQRAGGNPVQALTTIDLSSVPMEDAPAPRWVVPNLIPCRNVTDLSGDGGLGKSLLALQLGIAMTTGRDWIGMMPEPGKFLYISCEDEPEEIYRRRNAVLTEMGLSVSDLQGFHLADLTRSPETELYIATDGGNARLTGLFERLRLTIIKLQPACVVLDTRADVFGANEINRVQVRAFIRSLRSLCFNHDIAIILLSHPSVSGAASGTGQSGSTAWGNSVRSRLYLTTPSRDDESDDPDVRILSNVKANYGPRECEMVIKWDRGMFKLKQNALAGMDCDYQDRSVELRIMNQIEAFERQGRKLNSASGPNYLPKRMFEVDPTFRKRKYLEAMERLFDKGLIVNQPDTRGTTRITLTPEGEKALKRAVPI